MLIGRNGSGKSNIVDGLEVLSKLALGEDIRDSITADGAREPQSVVASRVVRRSGKASSRSAARSVRGPS